MARRAKRFAFVSVEGVVLAAGLSTRSGRWKMTLPFGDTTVIEHCIAGMYEVVERVIVVAGYRADELCERLAGWGHHGRSEGGDYKGRPYKGVPVQVVLNERYGEGMFSSVQAGVAAVRAARFFLVPGDYPLIGPAVYRRMLAVEGPVVIPTHGGKKGHPVLIDSGLIPEIMALPAGARLRDYLARQRCALVEVEDEGVLLDLDTPADYEALRARYGPDPHGGA